MGGLYEPTRLDFLEHLEDGRISYQGFNLHHLLRCWARRSHIPGVLFTSALVVSKKTDHSEKKAQRLLKELEEGGYIKRFWNRGDKGTYPVAIDKFEVYIRKGVVGQSGSQSVGQGVGQPFRVNAHETRDWRKPKLEPVGHSVGHSVGRRGSPRVYKEPARHSLLDTTTPSPFPSPNSDETDDELDHWSERYDSPCDIPPEDQQARKQVVEELGMNPYFD